MGTIVIEKFVDGICVEELKLPVAPLKFLAGLLPSQAHRELQRHGIDVATLLNDRDAAADEQWLEVQEGTVAKRVRITRRS